LFLIVIGMEFQILGLKYMNCFDLVFGVLKESSNYLLLSALCYNYAYHEQVSNFQSVKEEFHCCVT